MHIYPVTNVALIYLIMVLEHARSIDIPAKQLVMKKMAHCHYH